MQYRLHMLGLRSVLAAFALVLLSSCGGGGGGVAPVVQDGEPSVTPNPGRAVASMSIARRGHSAVLLADGKVLVTGGNTGYWDSPPINSAEIYDPATNSWTTTAPMLTARWAHKSLLLPSGRVLVVGGYDENRPSFYSYNPPTTATAEEYDPISQTWSNVTVSSFTGPIFDATSLANGDVLVTGGVSFDPVRTSAAIYRPGDGTWTSVPGIPDNNPDVSYNTNRHGVDYTSLLLQDGRVLVLGGRWDIEYSSGAATLFDPSTRSWVKGAELGGWRPGGVGITATLLPQGKVLVTGGSDPDWPNGFFAATDLYDPVLDKWSPVGALITPRAGHTATLMPDGSVMVIGGGSESIERLAPGSNTWVPGGTLINSRDSHTATLLPNGTVLVVGGGTATAELRW